MASRRRRTHDFPPFLRWNGVRCLARVPKPYAIGADLAHLHFVAHPTDARLNCLTSEQVQQLATLHTRPFASLAAASPGLRQEATPLPSTLSPPSLTQQNETPLADAPGAFTEEAELRKAVCALEAKVMVLQEHPAQLTLELLRERSERYERRLSSLEALLSQRAPCLPAKAEEVPVIDHHTERPSQRSPHPGEAASTFSRHSTG